MNFMTVLLAQANDAVTDLASDVQINSVWDFVQKGRYMMVPIIGCSLVALAVLAERVISSRRRAVVPAGFWAGLKPLLEEAPAQLDAARQHCEGGRSPVARVLGAGLRRLDHGIDASEKAIVDFGEREVVKLRKGVRILAVIASVAPLMGLLGTIFGLIRAFQTVATSENALGRAEVLATGIYEAMITTAAGLLVAIPTLLAYHWITARIEQRTYELNEIAADFLEICTPSASAPAAQVVVSAPAMSIPQSGAAPVTPYDGPPPLPPADPHGTPSAAAATEPPQPLMRRFRQVEREATC